MAFFATAEQVRSNFVTPALSPATRRIDRQPHVIRLLVYEILSDGAVPEGRIARVISS